VHPDPDVGYGQGPGSREAIAAIRGIYDAFARRDIEGALRHIAEEVEIMPAGTASRVGRTEPYRGHAGVREYFADAQRVWQDLTLVAGDVRATAGGVVVFGHAEGVSARGPMRQRLVWVWQVRDGRATSMRVSEIGAAGGSP
jgi:ketosteroid isomerase-like protein